MSSARLMSTAASVSRRAWVGGNWKAAGSVSSIAELCKTLAAAPPVPPSVDVVVAPSALHVSLAKSSGLPDSYQLAAQDVWATPKAGAFTGCLTPVMVKDFGMNWTLVGHSERRHTVASESNELCANKASLALEAGLNVVFCIGELLEERKAGKTNDICAAQLKPVVEAKVDWSNIVVAYEPVWAIGTGETATPEQAEEVHKFLREWIAAEVGESVANSLRIVYGGSVKGSNSAALYAKENIDGFLVGGASLKPEFVDIIKSCE